MNRTALLTLLSFFYFQGLSFAQTNELLKESHDAIDFATNDYLQKELEEIRQNFARITHTTSWQTIDTVELNASTEGGVAYVYHGPDGREKFTVRYYGETGQSLAEYFLLDGSLSFVLEKRLEYNRPMYWGEEQQKEFNDSETFDPRKSILYETRTYFLGSDVVHQIDNQDCGSPFTQEYLDEEATRIWDAFNTLIDAIDAAAPHDDRTIVGVWQGTPELGSGWSDNYQFFEDGKFHFNHNQMVCDDSVLTESGNYTLDGTNLTLHFTSKTVLSGATLQPSSGSCASENELVGGEIMKRNMERTETHTIAFVSPLFDYEYLERILLDGSEFFRMMRDPNNYE